MSTDSSETALKFPINAPYGGYDRMRYIPALAAEGFLFPESPRWQRSSGLFRRRFVSTGCHSSSYRTLGLVLLPFATVVPYLLVSDPNLAVRLSHLIALTLLFLLGAWWGWVVGGRSIRIAAGLTLVGMTLVLLTMALGG
jgi:VIT1/CCC1 family predicted Fe2+/Mn2+ transporter